MKLEVLICLKNNISRKVHNKVNMIMMIKVVKLKMAQKRIKRIIILIL